MVLSSDDGVGIAEFVKPRKTNRSIIIERRVDKAVVDGRILEGWRCQVVCVCACVYSTRIVPEVYEIYADWI